MGMKVLIADPYPITREGLKKVIGQYTDLEICCEASNKEEFLTGIYKYKPDIVILESARRKSETMELVKEVHNKAKNAKLLIYSANDVPETVMQYMELGVNGYLCKNCSVEEFIRGLNQMMKQGHYIQESIANRLKNGNSRKNTNKSKISLLTKRELEILILVSNGMLNKEIANKLCISERTVKNHLSSIFKKIEVSDRTQAAIFSIKNGVINF